MTTLQLILIALSFAFGVLSIRKLRSYDVHEAEPLWKMAAVTLWGGTASIFISLFLYRVLLEQGVSVRDGMPFSYFWVGFIEEAGKFAALLLCWPLIKDEMDEPTDGPIYMACVALGFSLIENFFYASATPLSSPLIAIRLLICTPMHIAFSMIMGIAFYWAVRLKGGWGALVASYVAASVYHALYDIFVSYWFLLPGLYLILKGAYGWMRQMLGYTAALSPFRETLAEFIHGTPHPEIESGIECLDCGNAAPKPTYAKGRFRVQKCEACGAYVCSEKSLKRIVSHYGSIFGNMKKGFRPMPNHRKHMQTLIAGNRIHAKKHIACFDLTTLNGTLEKMSRDVIATTEKKWWCLWKRAAD